jgi:hypothetical protein
VTPLEEIKRLYYTATRTTIQRDFARAIDLLKAMHTEEERERAVVYMEGLAEMRKEWAAPRRRK